jgi:hypothetical protein
VAAKAVHFVLLRGGRHGWAKRPSSNGLLRSNGLLGRTGLPRPANFGRERRASVPIQNVSPRGSLTAAKAAVPYAKTVPESDVFMLLGLALSEKKIHQITETTEKPEE